MGKLAVQDFASRSSKLVRRMKKFLHEYVCILFSLKAYESLLIEFVDHFVDIGNLFFLKALYVVLQPFHGNLI